MEFEGILDPTQPELDLGWKKNWYFSNFMDLCLKHFTELVS